MALRRTRSYDNQYAETSTTFCASDSISRCAVLEPRQVSFDHPLVRDGDPITLDVATAGTSNTYVDIMGFAVFRITDVTSNSVDGYAISGVYADMNDPQLRRGLGWVNDLPAEAVEYILRAEKDEKVLVRYRHERGENTYKATFEGIVTNLERRYRETDSEYIKTELEKYMVTRPCPVCGGKRLRPEILGVTIGEITAPRRRL